MKTDREDLKQYAENILKAQKANKTFILHWRDGSTSNVTGTDIADAMNRAGWGRGCLPALDYHEEATHTIHPMPNAGK